jgi:hypothetical protein
MVAKIAASVPVTGAGTPASGAEFGKELAQALAKGGTTRAPAALSEAAGRKSAMPAASREACTPGGALEARAEPAAKARQTHRPGPTERSAGSTAPGQVEPSSGARILGEVQRAQVRLDQILKLAESGRTFSPAELLAFQAHTYRASQELEMAGKVVEKGTNAVKQTLQTQI